MKKALITVLIVITALGLVACGDKDVTPTGSGGSPSGTQSPTETPANTDFEWIMAHSHVSCHDPSVEYDNGKYYIFGSHLVAAVTEDLASWKYIKNSNSSYSSSNGLFETYRTVFAEPAAYVGNSEALWAPDVIYNKEMGKYCMYMSVNGTTTLSCIALATADNIEGPYVYDSTIIYSGFTAATVGKTDVLQVLGVDSLADTDYTYDGKSSNADYPNCIDATVFYGGDGELYMVYGSMSGGIFMVALDEATGRIDRNVKYTGEKDDAYFGTRIAGGQRKTGEGPYILYDEETGYYYLFLTLGYLNAHCGYQIREFRSKNVFGPYTDAAGNAATVEVGGNNVDYGVKLFGDYDFACLKNAYVSGGHNSAVKTEDGEYYLIYHQRFNNSGEMHEVRVHQMVMTEEGWLTALPYEYSGEKVEAAGYAASEIVGTYEYINHGLAMKTADMEIMRSSLITLEADGSITGLTSDGKAVSGSWKENDGSALATFTVGNETFKGSFAKQITENEKRETIVFSAVSDENHCIWGSRIEVTDEVRVARDTDVVETYLLPSNTKTALELPTTGDFGSTISWTSSAPEIIGTDGTFSRPLRDTNVTLIAKVSYGSASDEISCNVKVIGGLEPNTEREDGIIAIYTFEEGKELEDSSGNGYNLENFGVKFENGTAVFDGASYLQFPGKVTRSEILTVVIKFAVDDLDKENPLLTISDDEDYYFRFFVDTSGKIVGDAEARKLSGTQSSAAITGIGEWQRFGFNNGGTDSIDGYSGGSIAALNGNRAWRGATYGGFIGMEIEGLCNYIGKDLTGKNFLRGKIEEITFYNYYIGETGLKTCFE